jgi:riboflavin kinase/FMN adenylyltransferase
VEAVSVVPFTLEFSRLDPDEFVRQVLVERLHAAAVVEGEDFTFGHRALGDVALLARLGEKYDYTAEGLPLFALDRVTFSSTSIRQLLAAGEVTEAAKMLGRPHRVDGVVARGHQRGRLVGFPTANVESPPHTAIPADGVYAGWLAALDGSVRPLRAYALDRGDLDLYGLHVGIDFAVRLRGMLHFESADALVEQMRTDAEQTREICIG